MTSVVKNVLVIKSSPAADYSVSNEMADFLVQELGGNQMDYTITVRDLASTPAPQLDNERLQAFFATPEQLTPAQQALVAPSLTYIEELKAADIVVIASAMHNFGITSLLKAYIDQICRAGLTFQYGEEGPRGLLTGKQAVIISSAGMDFQNDAARVMDFQSPYLVHILNFIGIEDVSLVPVQGVAMGDEVAAEAKRTAKAQLRQLAATCF